MEWADVLWFDCVDGNLVLATKKDPSLSRGKKVIVRAIDIDIWAGHFRSVDWSKVDHLIFIAPHIRDYFLSHITLPDSVKVHLIPCGVDLNKFTMRRCPERNNDVAVVMRLWHGKGIDYLLQLIASAPEFTFHICGKWGLNGLESKWYKAYIDSFLSRYDNWTHVEQVKDMNEWLEDKAFALVCSKKEAFSFAAAEGAAKGLKPIIHNFFGAEDTWPEEYRWDTIGQAVEMLNGPYEPFKYRRFIERVYPASKMLKLFDEIICGD